MDQTDARKRSANVTEEQKTLLLQFMEENPRLISGKFFADFTYKDATILWQKITNILNSCNGVSKDWKSWRKCWQDLRSRSKMKQSKINAEQRKTGGGSESHLKLSPIEEATLNLISPICIDGHTEIKESEVQIQTETDEINVDTHNIEMEYVEQDFEDIIQTTEHNASSVNMKNAETEDNDKENTYTNNDAGNSNNGNDDLCTIIRKKKRKSHSEEVQSTQQSQNLTNIAQKTFEIQNSYYEKKLVLKKQELQLKERFIIAAERCNTS
nr:PREDICTED: uncharacterized protein LOC105679549 isoform X1 [Linepithema humile]